MKSVCALGLLVAALILGSTHSAKAGAPDKLSTLSNSQLSSLVSELDAFYKQALDRLFAVNKDEDERALGQRVSTQLLASYDARVAGRCTKMMAAESFNQYLAVVHARLAKSADDAAKLVTDFEALLAKYALTGGDLRKNDDCPVFEYELQPLYESPITVFDPGFWWWQSERQVKTFIRLSVVSEKADGTVELQAVVGDGHPKGTYRGTAKRDLHSTSIQVSLLRDGDPLLIDGTVEMSGQAFKDPLTGEAAPKLPARVLTGVLSVHDGDKHTINDAVLLLARDSDAAISSALGGFKIPAGASYGSYLDVVLIEYKGAGVGAQAAKLAGIVDAAYKDAQKDNPLTSFHPTRKPLFLLPDEVAFLVTDIASDVNAEAAAALRAQASVQAARALGAQTVTVVPFWNVKKGQLSIALPGRAASVLKFDGFEQLAKALFTMYAVLGQEQDQLLQKFGIKGMSDEIKFFQAEMGGEYKALGPVLDALLDGREFDAELDKKISASMAELLTSGQQLETKLSTILDTLDGRGFTDAYAAYLEQQRQLLELVAAGVPADKADAVKQKVAGFADATKASLARADALAKNLSDNAQAIRNTLGYLNTFTVHIELSGIYVGSGAKLNSWTWKWDRSLSPALENFFTGEKNDKTKSDAHAARRGD